MIGQRLEGKQRIKGGAVDDSSRSQHSRKRYLRPGKYRVDIDVVFQFRALRDHGDLETREIYQRCNSDSGTDRAVCRSDLPKINAEKRDLRWTAAIDGYS